MSHAASPLSAPRSAPVTSHARGLVGQAFSAWDRFWFTPADLATLSLIRILAGSMLLYTHLVWTLDLDAFFGQSSWLSAGALESMPRSGFAWSYLWLCDTPWKLGMAHAVALAVLACFTLGIWTRVTSVLAWIVTVSYANRVPMALFGLDQVNGMLAMYLMLGPSGAAFSLDRALAGRRLGRCLPPARPSVSANVAIRLIQLHLCVIYLFAGLSKLQGPAWWNGTAFWGAVANLEYQSVDLTWLVNYPVIVNVLTHATILWEASYCALIWPRITRPVILLLAVATHVGIGMCLGMMTFGLAMLIANAAFIPPELVRNFARRMRDE